MNPDIMALTIEEARKSRMRHRVGAVVVNKKGKVVSSASNVMKSHPVQAMYAKKVNKEESIYLHAEIAAMLRCYREDAHSIYVARLLRTGDLGLAKPCSICTQMILDMDISEVYYTKSSTLPNDVGVISYEV